MNAPFSLHRRTTRLGPTISLIVSILGALAATAADPKSPALTPAPPAAATRPTPPAAVTFEAFRLIAERNIFNPNRVGRTLPGAPEAMPPREDSITLVGAMNSDTGPRAFFDSPDATYRKALREGDVIVLYTLRHIANREVELVKDDKPLVLKVGQRLRRAEGGDWTVAEGGTASNAAPTTVGPATSAPPVPADASETLRRLMKQRQKQFKQ